MELQDVIIKYTLLILCQYILLLLIYGVGLYVSVFILIGSLGIVDSSLFTSRDLRAIQDILGCDLARYSLSRAYVIRVVY